MAYSETELRSMLQTVLMGVCARCDFVHGEALRPSGNSCLVQSGASYSGSTGASDYHRASMNFYFPPNISLAGRVWKSGCTELHEDVSILPSTIFLRAELANLTELKTAIAMPLCKDTRVLAVCIFYTSHVIQATAELEKSCLAQANEILVATCARLNLDTSLRFKSGDPKVDLPSAKAKTPRAWQRCRQSLDTPPEERAEEHLQHIAKYSKGVQFFKYITNQQRIDLCKTMTYTTLMKDQVVMRGGGDAVQPPSNVWYVVVSGRVDMCVKTHADGQTYRMCAFKEGDTFASSYMKMFSTQPSITTHIEASVDTTCIVITVPDEYKEEFRTCTRPLWYEELSQFFHMSINEAADALGMCMSAIKKICRRHGISRWPHRKLASVNKTIAMLQSKISTALDDKAEGALRSEAVNVLTMKLRLTINPAYLVRDEGVLLPALGHPGLAGFGLPPGVVGPSVMPPFGGMVGRMQDVDAAGALQAGRGVDMGVDRAYGAMPARGGPIFARTEAEAAAAANAANVLQNVHFHNLAARGRGRDAGMGQMMGYPGMGKGEMAVGMGLGVVDPMMQQRLMFANQQHQQQHTQHRPREAARGGVTRRKGEPVGEGDGGGAFEGAEDGSARAAQKGNGASHAHPGGAVPAYAQAPPGGGVGMPPFYGMPGYGMPYPQGHPSIPGWQGGQLGPDAIIPHMGFAGYGMGMPAGVGAPIAKPTVAAALQQHVSQGRGKNKAAAQAAAHPAPQQQGGAAAVVASEPAEKRARLT